MVLTKTKAAALAGVSRRTLYDHILSKRISLTRTEAGTEGIELSELERTYGKEVIARNLKKELDQEEGRRPTEREVSPPLATPSVEQLMLRERVRVLEEHIERLELHQRRERETLQDQIVNLRENLGKAQDHHAQLTRLLSDGTGEQARRGAVQERKLQELEQTVRDLRKQNHRVIRTLRSERGRPWWRRFFGLR